MRCLGRLIGLVLVGVFLLVFPCSLWTFNTQRIALQADTYKQAFADEGFYEDLIPAVLPALLEGLQDHPPPPGDVSLLALIDHIPEPAWEAIAPDLVPMEWVEYEIETNLDWFTAWLEGDQDELMMVFHTDALRRRLQGSTGQQAMQDIMRAMPPCTREQEQQFDQFTRRAPGSEFPYCQPQNPALRTELQRILDESRRQAADTLPNELDIIAEMEAASREHLEPGEDPFTKIELARFRATIRLWQQLLPLTLLVPIALLSLIVIFAVRSAKTFSRWMGWALIGGSLIALVPLFLLPFIIHDLVDVEGEIEGGFATGGALLGEIVSERMVRILVGEFLWPVLVQAAITVGVGFLAVVISVLLHDPDAPPETVAPTYTTPSQHTPALAESPTRLDSAATPILPDDTPPAERTPPPEGPGQPS